MESSDCIMPSSRKEAPINRVLMCSLFLQFWITNLKRRRSPPSQNLRASVVRSAAGRPARKTNGSASAVIRGTPSRREAFAPSAYTSGAKREFIKGPRKSFNPAQIIEALRTLHARKPGCIVVRAGRSTSTVVIVGQDLMHAIQDQEGLQLR